MANTLISEQQVEAACEVASLVFDKKLRHAEGVEILATQHGCNRASAGDFINDFRCLVEGRVFQRAMSAMAMNVFMERIFATRPLATSKAVHSLWAHINYYEAHYKTRMHKLRLVVQKFEAKISALATLEHVESELSRLVRVAQLDSSAARRERLSKAPVIPSLRTVTAVVFDRNPDVIAEVLNRAGGVCEGCKKPAPFARVSTGEPYLEVHHRLRLADGGEDSVSNAIALCPNCHRFAHYGLASR